MDARLVTALDEIAEIAAELAERLPGRVERDVPSSGFVTYRCGGPFAVLVRAVHEEELRVLAELRARFPVPVLVVGRGANLLGADAGFAGVALVLGGEFEALDLDTRAARARAGGAVALPVLARRSAAAGIGGLEFFVGIPGSVGGAVRMNAGGHGRETRDVLVGARTVDLVTGAAHERTAADLELGYRSSGLTAEEVVVGATFEGAPDAAGAALGRIEEIVRWRRAHQPGGQNAGSVFTNPPGDAAGRLIDACGLKGLRIGGAVVSDKHANFFAADLGARASDVAALIRAVQQRVEEATGVRLRPEVHLIGFEEGSGASEPEREVT
jgi:UDP-N-acetylmuramate dehydrogenase